MKENKNYLIAIIVLIIIVIILLICLLIQNNNKEISKEKEINEVEITKKEEQKVEERINEETINKDKNITSYVDGIDKEIEDITTKEVITEKEKEKLKSKFKELTDFIFYGEEINGVTFKELREDTKIEIINAYNNIDSKIENKYPNYKETIKTTAKRTYINAKEQAKSLKEKIINSYKDYVGEDGYKETVDAYEEDKENLKETTKPYVEKGKSMYELAKEKVTSWLNK